MKRARHDDQGQSASHRCSVAQVDGQLELRVVLPADLVESAGVLQQASALPGASIIEFDTSSVLSLIAMHVGSQAGEQWECKALQAADFLQHKPLVSSLTRRLAAELDPPHGVDVTGHCKAALHLGLAGLPSNLLHRILDACPPRPLVRQLAALPAALHNAALDHHLAARTPPTLDLTSAALPDTATIKAAVESLLPLCGPGRRIEAAALQLAHACDLEATMLPTLLRSLTALRSLSLRFAHRRVESADCSKIAHVLETASGLTRLELFAPTESGRGMQAMHRSIGALSALATLQLVTRELHDAADLAAALRHASSLRTLHLCCSVTTDDLTQLALYGLPPGLSELRVLPSPEMADGAAAALLLQSLRRCSRLRVLDLTSSRPRWAWDAECCNAVRGLQRLRVCSKDLQPLSAAAATLTSLSWTVPSASSLREVAGALRTFGSLRALDLRGSCRMEDHALRQIAEAMGTMNALSELRLTCCSVPANSASLSGLKELRAGPQLAALQLSLSGAGAWTADTCAAFADALRPHNSLTSLHVRLDFPQPLAASESPLLLHLPSSLRELCLHGQLPPQPASVERLTRLTKLALAALPWAYAQGGAALSAMSALQQLRDLNIEQALARVPMVQLCAAVQQLERLRCLALKPSDAGASAAAAHTASEVPNLRVYSVDYAALLPSQGPADAEERGRAAVADDLSRLAQSRSLQAVKLAHGAGLCTLPGGVVDVLVRGPPALQLVLAKWPEDEAPADCDGVTVGYGLKSRAMLQALVQDGTLQFDEVTELTSYPFITS